MNVDLTINSILSEKNVAGILVYLYVFGPRTRTELYRSVSSNPRMPVKLQMLIDYDMPGGTGGDVVSLNSTKPDDIVLTTAKKTSAIWKG